MEQEWNLKNQETTNDKRTDSNLECTLKKKKEVVQRGFNRTSGGVFIFLQQLQVTRVTSLAEKCLACHDKARLINSKISQDL